MIQVQVNLQDPASPSLQAHLRYETTGLGPGERDAGGQEVWARGLLGSVGVCKAGALGIHCLSRLNLFPIFSERWVILAGSLTAEREQGKAR